jgi:hypothetical protein
MIGMADSKSCFKGLFSKVVFSREVMKLEVKEGRPFHQINWLALQTRSIYQMILYPELHVFLSSINLSSDLSPQSFSRILDFRSTKF